MNEFQELVDRWLDGDMSLAEVERLNRYLVESRDNRETFARQVQFHSMLRKRYRVDRSLADGFEDVVTLPSRSARRRRTAAAALAALSILLLAFVWNWQFSSDPVEARRRTAVTASASGANVAARPVARIDAASSSALPNLRASDVLYTGDRIKFEAGKLHLRFDVGATVVLQGPADMEITSARRAILYRGQATAEVEESGHGFTIETPTADIVDLGTRFGVKVSEDKKSDVVVFEGVVDIDERSSKQKTPHPSQRLSAGEAVRIEEDGKRVRIPVIRQQPSGTDWSVAPETDEESAISFVKDNLSSTEKPKFYSVVPGGFADGAKAYVDRPYLWTGWNGEKFPEELIGGDYIQTFCDDKGKSRLEIRVGVSSPAHFFVLFDSRLNVPEWLSSQFEDTGHRLAVKGDVTGFLNARKVRLGRLSQEQADLIASQEPSLHEYQFSVWRRTKTEPGEVRLGSVSSQPPRTMYGVVIVPQ